MSSRPHSAASVVPVPRADNSVLLLSPTNQILLLHRVKTSSAFPSAHVFPGGTVSEFHEEPVPPPGNPKRHWDSEAYQLAAIREMFEESGILLAKPKGKESGTALLQLDDETRTKGRKATHADQIKFTDWLDKVGGVADLGTSMLVR